MTARPIRVGRITVTRYMNDKGEDYVVMNTDPDEGLNVFEVLGILDLAREVAMDQYWAGRRSRRK